MPVADPKIAKGIKESRVDIQVNPSSSVPGSLPFGPYAQTASVGSYQYKDPSDLPAELQQMKQLFEDIRSFLAFEGASIANSSDPSVSLPLTQLNADSQRLQQEIAVVNRNPGIQASLNQQDLADIQGSLTFLQRKARLFQTAGVVSGGTEGFVDVSQTKTKANKAELQLFYNKIHAAILILTASSTKDAVITARISALQKMYSDVGDMISKLTRGLWTAQDVPLYSQDIKALIPNLAKPSVSLTGGYSSSPGSGSGNAIGANSNASSSGTGWLEKELVGIVGEDNARSVFNNFKNDGSLSLSLNVGYNLPGMKKDKKDEENKDGQNRDTSYNPSMRGIVPSSSMNTYGPYDSNMRSSEDRADSIVTNNNSQIGRLDWNSRAKSICEQVKLRGLDPLDFGCIPEGSKMSPAYSWRGHAKMVCGRLGATMDPGLPEMCGCPPPKWKGWEISNCLAKPPASGATSLTKACPV